MRAALVAKHREEQAPPLQDFATNCYDSAVPL
jgi:hypothetical protein